MNQEIKDTRGRPRNEELDDLSDAIQKAYMTSNLPLKVWCDEPKKLAKRLRMSTSFKEMQEEIETPIRVLVHEDVVICCLRKDRNAK